MTVEAPGHPVNRPPRLHAVWSWRGLAFAILAVALVVNGFFSAGAAR